MQRMDKPAKRQRENMQGQPTNKSPFLTPPAKIGLLSAVALWASGSNAESGTVHPAKGTIRALIETGQRERVKKTKTKQTWIQVSLHYTVQIMYCVQIMSHIPPNAGD